MSDLNTAIQLTRQGDMAQAQKILETIVRTETNNVPAWLWYAQTFPSMEMRLKVLVACMKFNPGNEQVLQAIRLIKTKTTTPLNPPAETPANQQVSQAGQQASYDKPVEKPIANPSNFAQIQPQQPVESKPAFNWDQLEQPQAPIAPAFEAQAQPVESRPAFNWDEFEKASAPAAAPAESATGIDAFFDNQPDIPSITKTKAPSRSYSFYEVWWTALTKPNVQAYTDLLDDPEAGAGRAIEWQVYTNLIILVIGGLVVFFRLQSMMALPEFQELQSETPLLSSASSNVAMVIFLLVFVIVGVVFGVLGLLLNGAIQNFLAHLFGGTGNFSRTVYALGAYLIPVTIIVTVMSYIPLVNCLTILVTGYSIALNVRALQAAHRLNGGRATIIVFIPTLIVLIIGCLGFTVLSSWMGTMLKNYPIPTPPNY